MGDSSTLYLVTELIIRSLEGAHKILRDGKISRNEYPDIFNMGSNFFEISKYLKEATKELGELSPKDFEALKAYIVLETEIDNDIAEGVIETSVTIALTFYRFLKSEEKK